MVQLDVVTQSGQVNSVQLRTVGLVDAAFKDIDRKLVMLPLQTAARLMDTNHLDFVSIELRDDAFAGPFLKAFREEASQAGVAVSGSRWQDHPVGDLYQRTMSLLSIFRNFIVAVILWIAGLSVFTTMVKIVKGRVREIGTLRSLGYRPRQIIRLFALESVLLASGGCAIALIASWLLGWTINQLGILYKAGMLTEPVPFIIHLNRDILMQSWLLLSFIAIAAASVASWRAARVKVSDNLIHV
jgi:putative ABC transport system permease protein